MEVTLRLIQNNILINTDLNSVEAEGLRYVVLTTSLLFGPRMTRKGDGHAKYQLWRRPLCVRAHFEFVLWYTNIPTNNRVVLELKTLIKVNGWRAKNVDYYKSSVSWWAPQSCVAWLKHDLWEKGGTELQCCHTLYNPKGNGWGLRLPLPTVMHAAPF